MGPAQAKPKSLSLLWLPRLPAAARPPVSELEGCLPQPPEALSRRLFAAHDYGLARVVERAVAGPGIDSGGLRDMLLGSLAPRAVPRRARPPWYRYRSRE